MARKAVKPISASNAPSTSYDSSEPISHADISALAYQLWQERGCPEGSPEEDWYEAERKLQSEAESQATFA